MTTCKKPISKLSKIVPAFNQTEIVSCGLIPFTFKLDKNGISIFFGLGKRRDSIGYIVFIKNDIKEEEMPKYISHMSMIEKKRIVENSNKFIDIWEDCGFDKYSGEYYRAYNNFKKNIEKFYNLFLNSNSANSEPDNCWIFPKGRLMKGENNIDCAIREFWEEIGINRNYLKVIPSSIYQEPYIGSDGNRYKNIFYPCYIPYKYHKNYNYKKINSKLRIKTLSDEIETFEWFKYDETIKNLNENSTNGGKAKSVFIKDIYTKILDVIHAKKLNR